MLQKYFPDANEGLFNGFDDLNALAGIGHVVYDFIF